MGTMNASKLAAGGIWCMTPIRRIFPVGCASATSGTGTSGEARRLELTL
jgi:hypothetical protein